MNRRGFFSALVGGIAASAGIRVLVSARMILPRSIFVGRSDVVLSRVGAHLQAAQVGAFESSELATGAPVAGIRIPVVPRSFASSSHRQVVADHLAGDLPNELQRDLANPSDSDEVQG